MARTDWLARALARMNGEPVPPVAGPEASGDSAFRDCGATDTIGTGGPLGTATAFPRQRGDCGTTGTIGTQGVSARAPAHRPEARAEPPAGSVSRAGGFAPNPGTEVDGGKFPPTEWSGPRDGDALAAFFDAEEERERTGSPIPRPVADAFAEAYGRHLSGIWAATSHPDGRRYLETAIAFCREGWAAQALCLGWTTRELFSVPSPCNWARLDFMGWAYFAHEPMAVTAESIALASGLTCRRRPSREGMVP